jgi:hypothetical protein
LFTGNSIHRHNEKEKDTDGAALLFEKPYSSHFLQLSSAAQQGYACFFTEGFLKSSIESGCIQHSGRPAMEGSSIYLLKPKQTDLISFLFRRMIMEQNTAYIFKNELLRHYLHLLLHEVFKMQSSHCLR